MILFHVTSIRNLGRIMRDGLVPRIGPRSKRAHEPRGATFFFPTIELVEEGLENWMANEFGEEARLALLAVTIPSGMEVMSDIGFERHVHDPIPPQNIRVLSKDVFGEVSLADLV